MIGTPISCTLWEVAYRHRNLDPPSRLVRLGLDKQPDKPALVEGKSLVMTADATGGDLCQVAARTVLAGKCTPEHEFTLTHVHRIGDAKGLAQLEQRDAGQWPPELFRFVPAAGGSVEADPGVVSGEAASVGFAIVSDARSESSEAPPAAGTESK